MTCITCNCICNVTQYFVVYQKHSVIIRATLQLINVRIIVNFKELHQQEKEKKLLIL